MGSWVFSRYSAPLTWARVARDSAPVGAIVFPMKTVVPPPSDHQETKEAKKE
jgi:hypothetical protein